MDGRVHGIGQNKRPNMFWEIFCFSNGMVNVWGIGVSIAIVLWRFRGPGTNAPNSSLPTLYLSQLLHKQSPICTGVPAFWSAVLKFALRKQPSTRKYPWRRSKVQLTGSVLIKSVVPYFLIVSA